MAVSPSKEASSPASRPPASTCLAAPAPAVRSTDRVSSSRWPLGRSLRLSTLAIATSLALAACGGAGQGDGPDGDFAMADGGGSDAAEPAIDYAAGVGSRPVTTDEDPPVPASGTVAVVPNLPAGTQPRQPEVATVQAKEVPLPSAQANVRGAWSAVGNWPLIAIHATLMADGRVMTFGTTETGKQTGLFNYDVWDSAADGINLGHMTLPNGTSTDIFCASQTLFPLTGEVFIAGGDRYVNGATTNTANNNTTVFSGSNNTLTRTADMARPRWYSSVTTLADGQVYIQGGSSGTDYPEVRQFNGSSRLLSTAGTSGFDYWYPKNFVASDGRLFGFDVVGRMYSVDTQGTGTVERHSNLVTDFMGAGSSAVLYAPGKVLQIGGNSPRSAVIDFNGALPVVTETAPVATSRRYWVSGTVLPDGRVLATGGSTVDNQLSGVNNTASLWDPRTGAWTHGAAGALARLYHSVALLLPDATVLVAGGGAPGPLVNTNAEIYYPPYLFNAAGNLAPRPQITTAPTSVTPGTPFQIQTAGNNPVSKLVMIRTGSVTHSVNFDQRLLELPFTLIGNTATTRVPASPALIPPGFYLLFALDSAGVPSIAKTVQVTIGNAADIHADWTGRLGPTSGTNGTAFELACSAGEVAVGIYGRTSTNLTGVGPRCVTVGSTGQWTGTPVNRSSAGATTGTSFTRTCPTNSALTGLRGAADANLNSVILSCSPLSTAGRVAATRSELESVGSSGGTARPWRGCGFRHPAHALYGTTASSRIQSLGLLCRGDADPSATNQPPVIASPGFQLGRVGTPLTLQLQATDADLDTLAWSATGLPAGLSLNPGTGLISGTPTTAGRRTVTVTVSDGTAQASTSFEIEIASNVNLPPNLVSPGSQRLAVGSTVNLQLQATDPEGQALSWSASGLPPSLAINATTGRITGTVNAAGNYASVVAVSDGSQQAQVSILWEVTSGTTQPDSCNRFVNGGFDAGTTGWSVGGGVSVVNEGVGGSPAVRINNGWMESRVPVSADEEYELSLQYRQAGTTGWGGIGVDFYDEDGNRIGARSDSLGNAAALSEYRLALRPVPGAVEAKVWFVAEGGRVLTVDQIDWRRAGCGTAGPVDSCNRIANPGFENGTTGWQIQAAHSVVGGARSGSSALSMTDGWGEYSVPVTPGEDLTGTAWVKVSGNGWAGMGINFFDAQGNRLQDNSGTLRPTSSYSPFTLSARAPANAAVARLWFVADAGVVIVADDVNLKASNCGQAGVDACNRLTNPGFERGFTDWTRAAVTGIVAGGRSGSAATVTGGWISTKVVGVAGRSYTGRLYYQVGAGSGWANAGLHFFDAQGNRLGEVASMLEAGQGWRAATATGVAPAGTAEVHLWVYTEGAVQVTVDDADLRETNCSTPPVLDPCNVLANPGFELGTASWDQGAYVQLVSGSRTGSKAAQFRNGWMGSRGTVTAGVAYRASAWIQAAGQGGWAGMGVDWFNAAGTKIGENQITLENRSTYGEVVINATPPAGTVTGRLWFYAEEGRTLVIDDAFLRRANCTPAN